MGHGHRHPRDGAAEWLDVQDCEAERLDLHVARIALRARFRLDLHAWRLRRRAPRARSERL
jgi:hypothetical protein